MPRKGHVTAPLTAFIALNYEVLSDREISDAWRASTGKYVPPRQIEIIRRRYERAASAVQVPSREYMERTRAAIRSGEIRIVSKRTGEAEIIRNQRRPVLSVPSNESAGIRVYREDRRHNGRAMG